MKSRKIMPMLLCTILLSGCSDLAGAKLLLPEQFGLIEIEDNLYIETGVSEATKNDLRAAMKDAELAIKSTYGSVTSKPVVNACITEECYRYFGGMGSRAKIYGNRILLSPRGLDWHFLAHEWSHDELRQRLTLNAWFKLPQWFDEGAAVAVSQAPEHSEAHWAYLESADIPRPSRFQLMSYRTLREWLDAVNAYGETKNQERKANGELEVRPVYTAAGHVVRAWLHDRGTHSLLTLIHQLNEGESFEKAYAGN